MAAEEHDSTGDDRPSGAERRSGDDRRKRRSSFVERIGRARARRAKDKGVDPADRRREKPE
jgi:hypothetical protein